MYKLKAGYKLKPGYKLTEKEPLKIRRQKAKEVKRTRFASKPKKMA